MWVKTERVNRMIRLTVRAYDDDGHLVCHLIQQFERSEVPNWTDIEYQFEEELLQRLGEEE